ncbi:importin subunit beta-3 isoform X1 [Jatropha curcas]|uniref:importin subunit beta-3 isoform X1 n=1 Tax=Jatropha curcas TaxID=180498 RepID=UPI0009D6B1AF|nr:importin subunit beta-3 isoform X1 [Jatropha curcas]
MESSRFPEQLQAQAYQILSSNDVKLMEALFSLLLSPQEPQRSHAYNLLLCCKDHYPCLLFIKLFYLLRYASNMDTRANSARILRFVQVQNLWPKLSPHAQVNVKTQVLDCLKTEQCMPFLRIICGVVSEIAGEVYKRQEQWKELLEFLVRCLAMENEKFQEIALLVFSHLPNDCRRVICDALLSRIEVLHGGLLRGLASNNFDVKIAAFGSVISLLHLFSGSLGRDWLNDLFRTMMLVVFDLLKGEKEECAQKGLQELINLVTKEPQILRPYLNSLVSDMLKIAESRIIKDKTKNCAIEFLMTVVEANDLAPALKVLPSASMVGLFIIPMRMLLGIQDDIAWYEMGSIEGDNAGKTDTYNYGIKCLKQMSIVLGGKNIVPIGFKLLPTYMDAIEWQRRHAGITMLGVISKECSQEMIMMEDYLQQALTMILRSFQDSHPRVCWAAFNFMQMHTDVVGSLQILHHSRIVPALLAAVGKKQNPRVAEEVASALLFFVKSIYQDCLTIYMDLDMVLRKLLAVLQDNNRTNRCRTISLRTFNIVVKQRPEVCFKHCVDYLPVLLEACTDKNSELRKEATLGIRICAQFGGSQFRPFIKSALSKLGGVMAYSDRSCREDLEASDIAVSAIGVICEFHRALTNAAKLVPTWLSFLPIKDDLVEARFVHEQLCSMVERSDIVLLGNNCQHLHKIILVFLEVISQGSNLASPQTVTRMKHFLQQMWRKFPRNVLDPILLSMNAQQLEVLANEVGFVS